MGENGRVYISTRGRLLPSDKLYSNPTDFIRSSHFILVLLWRTKNSTFAREVLSTCRMENESLIFCASLRQIERNFKNC